MSVRKRVDDGHNEMPMLHMSPENLRECEDLYNEGYIHNAGAWHVSQAQRSLKNKLTRQYTDPVTFDSVKSMMYHIPSNASAGLKSYMERLESEYESLNPKKRPRRNDDGLPNSIPPQNRARIIELRENIESNKRSQAETRQLINRWTDLILLWQKDIQRMESLLPTYEGNIRKFQAEIESLGGGTAHTGSHYHDGMRYHW